MFNCLDTLLRETLRLNPPAGREQNPGSVSPLPALRSSARWRSGAPAALDRVHQGRPGVGNSEEA